MDFPRKLALEALYKIDKEEAYSNIVLDELLNKNRNVLSNKDINFISELVYGVTTWKLTLDTIIQKYSKIKIKKISPWVINILRMGAYQIVFLDKVPKSAAVNESVNLCKKYGGKSVGFVNAILRKVEKSDYEELYKIEDEKEKISKTQSMPIWIIEELLKNNTIEEVNKICESLSLKPELSIRVNKIKTTKRELVEKLESQNIQYKNGELEDFLILQNVKNIERIPEFKQGLFTVQDESAGLAALTLNPKKGETVLDACSAPGGKTTYLAELMENEGKIDAWDIYEHRIKLINENCQRLGINIVQTYLQDAQQQSNKKYDKILLDVPCLGIGVIKRKPDIKWQRKQEDIQSISQIQYNILKNCAKLLNKGGELVYSTCSILKDENEDVINKFIKENDGFEVVTKNEIMPSKEHDGFFICKLKHK